MDEKSPVQWPSKCDVFGALVSATTYEEVLEVVLDAAQRGIPATVAHLPVHGLVLAGSNAAFRAVINAFDVVAPDGQPVRWALNLLHDTGLSDRVYGPELMLRLCRRAADQNIGIYLYGSLPRVVEKLREKLLAQFPALHIVGCEAPPFRPLTTEEDSDMVERINSSGAALVFVGLGLPKQEIFAHEHSGRIRAVQLCVGAAFDFLSRNKPMAPPWMQKRGLEWLFRLMHEPVRLFKRYFITNTVFLLLLAGAILRRHLSPILSRRR